MKNFEGKEVCVLEFSELGDERGQLVVIESKKNVPFDMKRIFYIYGSDPGVIRGQHANQQSEFVLINVKGSSKVKVWNGKDEEKIYVLDRPNMGIYLPAMVWKDMYDFSEDSVLMVLASEYYDQKEYVRTKEEFEKEING